MSSDTLAILNRQRNQLLDIAHRFNIGNSWIEALIDYQGDKLKVVVVGEFSTGKTTFVNALVGESILPMDLSPTTARVTRLQYSTEPFVRLHMDDGSKRDAAPGADSLASLSLMDDEQTDLRDVSWIEVGWPSPILQHVILVDTPGVHDLSDLSREMSYLVIRQADVVLVCFRHPVNRTLIEYLRQHVLPLDHHKYIFLQNMSDLLPGILDEAISSNQATLRQALDRDEINLIGIASKELLQKAIPSSDNNHQATQNPNILETILAISDERNVLILGYRKLLWNARNAVHDALELELETLTRTKSEVLNTIAALETSISESATVRAQLGTHLKSSLNEVVGLLEEEIDRIASEIRRDAEQTVATYDGTLENLPLILSEKVSLRIAAWQSSGRAKLERRVNQIEEDLNRRLLQTLEENLGDGRLEQIIAQDTTTEIIRVSLVDSNILEHIAQKGGGSNLVASMSVGIMAGGLGSAILGVAMPLIVLPVSVLMWHSLSQKRGAIKQEMLASALSELAQSISDAKEKLYTIQSEIVSSFDQRVETAHQHCIERYKSKLSAAQANESAIDDSVLKELREALDFLDSMEINHIVTQSD
ncbi:MAG: dynamin family protein [Deltaproteobacteria bacterium]|nr:dynamin family protein [Deltaproteobacteria bacterium]MCB9488921.1 dynamin family protein [Deltaproteobacteria bacterium]